jgi:hypothetical protein
LVSAIPESKTLSVQPLKEVRVRMAEHDLQQFNEGKGMPNHNFKDLLEEVFVAREDRDLESDDEVNSVKICTACYFPLLFHYFSIA